MEEIKKLKPYDKLQSILSEGNAGKLTDSANNKLDFLLDIEKRESFFEKIINFFKKIDAFVFKTSDNKTTNQYHRR